MSSSNVVALPPRPGALAAFAGRNLPDMNAAAQHGIQASFAVIGFKGRNWRIKHRGEEKLLLDQNNVPVPVLDAVIVGISQAISKQFYLKKFSEGDDAAPDCFSVNGVVPDPASPAKQCETCAVCPQNRWGSRISDTGSKGKACQDTRRLAIVPYGDFQNEAYGGPMMLRLPPTSLVNLANYGRELTKFGAQPFAVRTKIGFNYEVAYPLITFNAAGWLTEEDAQQVVEVLDNPLIERMLDTEVVEVNHDPAEPPSALAQGGPPKAFAPTTPRTTTEPEIGRDGQIYQRQVAAEPAPTPPAPKPKPAPAAAQVKLAPAPEPKPEPEPEAAAEDDEEAKLAAQLEQARARKLVQAQAKVKAEAEAQAQAQQAAAAAESAQTSQPEPEPKPAKVALKEAPDDLTAAIAGLLGD